MSHYVAVVVVVVVVFVLIVVVVICGPRWIDLARRLDQGAFFEHL